MQLYHKYSHFLQYEKNNTLYEKYKELSKKDDKVFFGGRLGQYKYYDMDKVIEIALDDLKRM